METRRRSLAKAASWRVIATLITTGIAWAVTGEIETGLQVGAFDMVIKLAAFYGHERVWIRLPYGRPREP